MKKVITGIAFLCCLLFITPSTIATPIEKKKPKKILIDKKGKLPQPVPPKKKEEGSLEKAVLLLMNPVELLIAEKRVCEGRELMYELDAAFNLLNTKDPDLIFQKTEKRLTLAEIEANLKEIIVIIPKVQRQLRKDEYVLLMVKTKKIKRFKQLATSLSNHAKNIEKEDPKKSQRYHYFANIFYVLYLRNKQDSRELIARISKPLKQYGTPSQVNPKKEEKKKEESSSNIDTLKGQLKLLQTLIKLETEELIKKIKKEIESLKKKYQSLKQQYLFRALILRYIIKQKIAQLEVKIRALLKKIKGLKQITP